MNDNQTVTDALNEATPKERIKFRVGFTNRLKTKACMLAYVDARYVMDKLDESVGKNNWSIKYDTIGSSLFCSIEMKWPDGSITTKADCGMETEVDAEKGQASDAFKRAAVHYGVGRDLYSMKKFWTDCGDNGYVDQDWKPIGWGSPTPLDKGEGDSTLPATPDPSSQPPPDPPHTADIDQMMSNKAQIPPKSDETPANGGGSRLKEGTPPENELVLVKNLLNQAKSKNGAILYLPHSFNGDPKDYEETKAYWVGAQFIHGETQLMNGRSNVTMTRWIAKEKGYRFEELPETPHEDSNSEVEVPEDLPF